MNAKSGNPRLRDRLAAEYVLGTMRGAARARFQGLLKYDPGLRRLVAEWEAHLTPMAVAAGEIAPPARLWQRIASRTGMRASGSTWWASLAFWRTCTVATTAAVLALAVYVAILPTPEPPIATVAVMSDDQSRPGMVVSWPQLRDARSPHIRVRIIQEKPTIPPDASWQLWILPKAKAAPIPLALVGQEPMQTIRIDRAQVKGVWQSWGLALSVEPRGGSPTGSPTGPVLFKGQCVRVM
jgi:anti-sigma-K factor RskA